VHVVGQSLDAGGEALRIRLDGTGRVALTMPAIVHHDIGVAGGLHAGGDYGIRLLADDRFIDVAAVFVPAVPTHRRCERQTIGLARFEALLRVRRIRAREQRDRCQHDPECTCKRLLFAGFTPY
jgi:hypothetical protein